MDGMGSPDGMMDHSMMDLKGGMGSPYSCYSSPKLPYDSFSNRGELTLYSDTASPTTSPSHSLIDQPGLWSRLATKTD